MDSEEITDIEIHLLLESLRLRFGYDFRNYSPKSVRRRIQHCLAACEFNHISEVIPKLLHDCNFVNRLVATLTVTVTEMFRDPEVFKELRKKVVPVLRTYPFINIWHAGCSTGEEVYSMAILLKEEGLYDRAQIYATDLNENALSKAREGIYAIDDIKKHTANYQLAGGTGALADYYLARYDYFQIDPSLKKNILFSAHNLAVDSVFAEMNLILCRNVFIYFNRFLQEQVLRLFLESLTQGGFLCLGTRESIPLDSHIATQFRDRFPKNRIFQKQNAGES